ncbi:MAG: prepilin-type N-terminal cleavage/methylation domain-containing protein [Candidatus Omnitrophica bacterium]|nr:prepilin-type N-terminal cleavage/methylation domain-containing protein [Candidatus Omnitrophota bacterium]
MAGKKGFTLIEIIIVMVIIGVLAAIVVSGFSAIIADQAYNAAKNNVAVIMNAQNNYYLNHGSYCIGSTSCSNLTSINNSLSVNIRDDYYTYACSIPTASNDLNFANDGFCCAATPITSSWEGSSQCGGAAAGAATTGKNSQPSGNYSYGSYCTGNTKWSQTEPNAAACFNDCVQHKTGRRCCSWQPYCSGGGYCQLSVPWNSVASDTSSCPTGTYNGSNSWATNNF